MSDFVRIVNRLTLAGDLNQFEVLAESKDAHEHFEDLIAAFFETNDWRLRDAYIRLLKDLLDPRCKDMMTEALESQSTETRAYAVCHLNGCPGFFGTFLEGSFVQQERVDKEIAAFKKAQNRGSH
jgi:hypothetical protein